MTSCPIQQFEGEPFWVYFNRVQDGFSLNNGSNVGEMCEFVYFGLNDYFRYVVESSYNGEFQTQSLDEAWDYFNWLAQDTYEWEMGMNESQAQPNFNIPPPTNPTCNDLHSNNLDVYPMNECMNYNDVSQACFDDSLLPQEAFSPYPCYAHDDMHPNLFASNYSHDSIPCKDESHVSNIDALDDPSPHDDSHSPLHIEPQLTMNDLVPQHLKEYDDFIASLYKELEHCKSVRAWNDTYDCILILKKKRESCRSSWKGEKNICENERHGNMNEIENDCWEDLDSEECKIVDKVEGRQENEEMYVLDKGLEKQALESKINDASDSPCEEIVPIPTPHHVTFSRKLELVPSHLVSLPPFLISPPLEYSLTHLDHNHLVKPLEENVHSDDSFGYNVLSSYFVDFSFSPYFLRWLSLWLPHLLLLTLGCVVCSMFSGDAYDRLMRSLKLRKIQVKEGSSL